jgi:colicin import membrane protein
MFAPADKKYFIVSAVFHLAVLLVLILGFDFSAPMVVIENTNKTDVISAVILGDTQKSKIVPQQVTAEPPQPPEPKPLPKLEPKPVPKPEPVAPKPIEKPEIKKDVIALKVEKKKKPSELFGKNLLDDIEKLKKRASPKKSKPVIPDKKLKASFEKSMRQQLLNEEIKMKGTQSRQAQGIVNKYQALIQQAISEHWIIPSQSNRKAYSMLLIRLAPGGQVLDVQVVKSSGDLALDNSARAAVLKASPLPVPSDPAAFEAFRQFQLKARPENIMDDASHI